MMYFMYVAIFNITAAIKDQECIRCVSTFTAVFLILDTHMHMNVYNNRHITYTNIYMR